MILVDSSVWIDFFRGKASPEVEWLDKNLGIEGFVVGDLILAEVLRGFKEDRGFREARRMLGRLEQLTPQQLRVLKMIADGLLNKQIAYEMNVQETTVKQQREENVHVKDSVTEEEFVAMRTSRDKTLSMPKLIMPSVQVNIRGGRLPEPEENGVSYIKIPVNAV